VLTRRALLAAAGATGLGVLAACTGRSTDRPAPSPVPEGAGLQAAGQREQLLAVGDFGMLNFPDGHLTYLATGTGYRAWVSSALPAGGGRTVALDTDDLVSFRPAATEGGDAVAGLAPARGTVAIDADYCGPGSVFPSADGASLWLVYHAENHTFAGVTNVGSPFYASIGLASSTDGGLTWQRRGTVITGQVPRDDRPAPRDVVGAGSPCALVADGLVHVFYVDWNLASPDQIHLARAPLDAVDDPAAWTKWHEGSFSTPGAGGASSAVVERPGDGDVTVFAGNPSVSWNTHLGQYVLVHESADGYWWTRSDQLTDWGPAERFLATDAPALAGTTFVSYPTLLSAGPGGDQVTDRDAHLYFAASEDAGSHSLWRVPVRFPAT